MESRGSWKLKLNKNLQRKVQKRVRLKDDGWWKFQSYVEKDGRFISIIRE